MLQYHEGFKKKGTTKSENKPIKGKHVKNKICK